MNLNQQPFWEIEPNKLLEQLETTPQGLAGAEAKRRLVSFGFNQLKARKRSDVFSLLFAQFKSPIILILLFAAILSASLGARLDAIIILIIILISGLLGFWQERGAANAIEKLLAVVQIKALALRDGNSQETPLAEIVPGDIVLLSAGNSIPGDCIILESDALFIDEAVLTGETFPVEKVAGVVPPQTPLNQRVNSLFMGTQVISGKAKAVVTNTGKTTEFGKIAERLRLKPPETEFERGIRQFGNFLLEVTLVLVIVIFTINAYLARPVLDSLLFSLALAVGLTPQLLPAIISINLAHGAKRMASKKVIVKRLASIENLGSMNVLCSDKTGTLTEGVVQIRSGLDINANESEKVLLYAYINSFFETGFTNPIDEAIRKHCKLGKLEQKKLGEIPYDFIRKRLSIIVSHENGYLMVTKGALKNVLDVCSSVEDAAGKIVELNSMRDQIQKSFEEFSQHGFRTLGIAYKMLDASPSNIKDQASIKDQESNMVFLGFITLFDPPKVGVIDTINELKRLGISLKIITGDNRLVAAYLGEQIGLVNRQILTGEDLHNIRDEALIKRLNEVNIFAEIEPNQKERIILGLKKSNNIVGYIGDGINDAPALHAADVSISVDSGVDVAKDAADIVLLEKDLGVISQGVQEGRLTFANTLKYVFMATSANFGNMFSMAGVSLFLPFLPLLPKQILLTNLMTDFPEMAIANDNVDSEIVEKPRRWDIKFIRSFMLTFGLLSSIFDYVTFGTLLFVVHASMVEFRTAWFIESIISAAGAVLIIRTRKPFFKSMPGKYLLIATFAIIGITLIIPFTPFSNLLGFSQLPISLILLILFIVLLYMITAEITKKIFYKLTKY